MGERGCALIREDVHSVIISALNRASARKRKVLIGVFIIVIQNRSFCKKVLVLVYSRDMQERLLNALLMHSNTGDHSKEDHHLAIRES